MISYPRKKKIYLVNSVLYNYVCVYVYILTIRCAAGDGEEVGDDLERVDLGLHVIQQQVREHVRAVRRATSDHTSSQLVIKLMIMVYAGPFECASDPYHIFRVRLNYIC